MMSGSLWCRAVTPTLQLQYLAYVYGFSLPPGALGPCVCLSFHEAEACMDSQLLTLVAAYFTHNERAIPNDKHNKMPLLASSKCDCKD
jgi:hypothetical protein